MTWIAVLNQAEMKIFTREHRSEPLALMQTMKNPLVGLKAAELTRHRPGMAAKGGRGSRVSILNSGENPHDLVVADFAHQLGEYLNACRKKNEFKALKIAAEPRFLGLIKSEHDSETKKMVQVWVAKDLQNETLSRIAEAFDSN